MHFPTNQRSTDIVKRIEEEQALVNSNKKLIEIFELIKDEINKLWQAAPKEYAMSEEKLSMAAEE